MLAIKQKITLVVGHGLIQKVDATKIYAEKMYSHNFTVANETFCLTYTVMVRIVIYLLMAKKSLNIKPKKKV